MIEIMVMIGVETEDLEKMKEDRSNTANSRGLEEKHSGQKDSSKMKQNIEVESKETVEAGEMRVDQTTGNIEVEDKQKMETVEEEEMIGQTQENIEVAGKQKVTMNKWKRVTE